jgi:hypothetical protein
MGVQLQSTGVFGCALASNCGAHAGAAAPARATAGGGRTCRRRMSGALSMALAWRAPSAGRRAAADGCWSRALCVTGQNGAHGARRAGRAAAWWARSGMGERLPFVLRLSRARGVGA